MLYSIFFRKGSLGNNMRYLVIIVYRKEPGNRAVSVEDP